MSSHRLILFLLTSCLVACTPRSVREAQDVVARADSCWQAGQPYADSACLARSFHTLEHWQWVYADDYVHACYHYGRLLREKENPVAAMECFIHATHSRSRDYHILGRVYSNMGSICHLANEFPLSYDMYEKSADMFLRNGDSLLYYYGLNNMAFELAEQGKKEETIEILSLIETRCAEENIVAKIIETKAEVYIQTQIYDSAIYYARQIHSTSNSSLLGEMQLAQAYSFLHIHDSATYYANIVLAKTTLLYEINNALYILTNNDITKNKDAIRETAANRADVQKLLEIRQGIMSQAVQFLTQDINRKPDLTWLYVLIATIIVISCFISVYVTLKRKKHKLLSQKVEDLTKAASIIQEKHDELSESYQTHRKRLEKELETNCRLLTSNHKMLKELVGGKYDEMCNIIDRDFHMLASKLRNLQTLTEPEVCLCILVFLGLTRQQIADLLHYANSGIGKFKYRVSLKLGIESKNLRNFLINMALDEPRK